RCFRTCTGSVTARDSSAPRDIGAPDGASRFLLQRRRPGVIFLRCCIPGPHVPLSTLRRRPRERLRMTQGRCGSLLHIRMTLSFTTPPRFNRRTRSKVMKDWLNIFRQCQLILRIASWIVPRAARAEWRKEWEAELAYAWRVSQTNEASARKRLRWRCCGAFLDAA